MATTKPPKGQRLRTGFHTACLSFAAMLLVALTTVRQHKPNLIRSIKHYATQ